MKHFGQFIVRKRRWVLSLWLVGGLAVILASPSLSSIESTNQSNFLPKSYPSMQAMGVAQHYSPQAADATDIIVFKHRSGTLLTPADQHTAETIVRRLSQEHIPHVANILISPEGLSANKSVQLAQVVYDGTADDSAVQSSVKVLRKDVSQLGQGTTLTTAITGEAAISADSDTAMQKGLALIGIGTILLVLLLPALIFRSAFAGLLPVSVAGIVYAIASALIADAGKLFHFHVSQQLGAMFVVVLFGVGTDYILFLLFRYRERLRAGDESHAAVAFALSRAGEAIVAAALVVMASFTALFFAKFGIFSSLAPGLVISIGLMLLAALTLAPALLAIIGERIFWPSKPQFTRIQPTWPARLGRLTAAHPGYIVTGVVIALAAIGSQALGYKADFSSFSQPPKGSESAAAYHDLSSTFPPGVLNPVQVYITNARPMDAKDLLPVTNSLTHTSGVAFAMLPTVSRDGTIVDIPLVLKDNPYSPAALDIVSGPLAQTAAKLDTSRRHAYIGGGTAIIADVRKVTNRDLRVLFPIAGLLIFAILVVLLRSLAAPLLLLLGVGLGYIATLGTIVTIFLNVNTAPGIISFIPLFLYIFVVAIGTDYNILTITRLREEMRAGNSPRRAARLTIEHTTATVASAGLILAGTFGSLMLTRIGFLSQMGAAIAGGVLLAAFLVAPLFIPSAATLLGKLLWWPSKSYRANKKGPK